MGPSDDRLFSSETLNRGISRRRFLEGVGGAAALLSAADLLAACGTQSSSSTKNTLVIGAGATPTGVDGEFDLSLEDLDSIYSAYDTLVEFPFVQSPSNPLVALPDFSKPSPGLAESWTVSPDGTSVTFKLRQGVKSAFGNELTAKDLVWKFDRGCALAAVSSFFDAVMSYKCPAPGIATQLDKYTVQITGMKPNALATSIWANPYLQVVDSTEAQKHATAADPWAKTWLTTQAGGFGPYYVTQWNAGQQIVWQANPHYWRSQPKIQKVIYKAIADSSSRSQLVTQGAVDIAMRLDPRQVVALKSNQNVQVVNLPASWLMFIFLNVKRGPLADQRVRQALNLVVPHQDILSQVYQGLATPLNGTQPDIYPWSVSFPTATTQDFAGAKQLLASANQAGGFTVSLLYNTAVAEEEAIAVLIKQAFAQINVTVNLTPADATAFQAKVVGRDFDMAFYKDQPIQPDPGYSNFMYFHTGSYVNYNNFSDSSADPLLEQGLTDLDPTARKLALQDAQSKIWQDFPWLFLARPGLQLVVHKNALSRIAWSPANNAGRWSEFSPA